MKRKKKYLNKLNQIKSGFETVFKNINKKNINLTKILREIFEEKLKNCMKNYNMKLLK